jgi:hypothetical protein
MEPGWLGGAPGGFSGWITRSPERSPRIYEISGPDEWADLAGRYPLDVSKSRRHDWWRITRWAGTWLIPDFAAVAGDYDAVHLSVTGYLTTADEPGQWATLAPSLLGGILTRPTG